MLVTAHLCNTKSSNGNKLIEIKYECVISRLASYELQCLDQALSWLFTGSRKTDDINSNTKPWGGKPLTSPCFWGFWVLNNFILPGWICTKNFMPHCYPKIKYYCIMKLQLDTSESRLSASLIGYFWIYLLSLGERRWFCVKRWCIIF